MNLAVEKPSSVLELKEVDSERPRGKSGCTIDFYGIDSDDGSKRRDGCVEDAMLRDVMETKMRLARESAQPHGTSRLTVRFFMDALKNDMRVKMYRIEESSIIVHFVTVNDAISFHQQYYPLVEMRFLRELVFDTMINEEPCVVEKAPAKEVTSEESPEEISPYDLKPFQCSETEKTIGMNLTESEFYARIEFFRRMGGMYSKSEVSKLTKEGEEEEGRLDYIIANAKVLAVGSVTNIILQAKIKEMTEAQLCDVIRSFGDDISAICATKYGAYTIQTLIMACSTEKTQALICKYFGQNGKYLFCHEIGNYSIQRILLFNEEYVLELIRSHLKCIIEHKLGAKVLKRCLKLLKGKKGVLGADIMNITTKKNADVCNEMLGALM